MNKTTDGREIRYLQWLSCKQLFEHTLKGNFFFFYKYNIWISLFITTSKLQNNTCKWCNHLKMISYLLRITKTPQSMNVITTSNHPPTMNLKKNIMVALETYTEKHPAVGKQVI